MALEFQGRQHQKENCDYKLKSESESPHLEECLDREGSHKITSDFPITSACSSSRTMSSQEPFLGDSDSVSAASSSEQEVTPGVQTLKALSLNGLNQNLCHSTSASEDSQSMPSGVKGGRPHPILSWGDVTEITNSATGKTQEYVKHPIGASSSGSDPWQVRSTQNPSRPLVRRPTPMAIRVPKSVLDKASNKLMTESFDEEDEDQVTTDGEESPVPVSLKQGTNTDVLVIEDVEDSDTGTPSPRLSTPKDLPLGLAVKGHTTDRGPDVGSPTIVVRTDIGEELSQEQAERLEDADDDDEEEEDDFDVGDKQFLSPTASKSFGKNPEPPASNSHIQTVPHQPRKFVRRQTPITLDLPKNLKDVMAKNTSEGIMEEEEEEEEEENNEVSESDQQKSEDIQATSNQVDDTETPKDNTPADSTIKCNTVMDNTTSLDAPDETENTEVTDTNTIGEDTSKKEIVTDQAYVLGRPDTIDSVNCNNNNHEASPLDLVDGTHENTLKSQVGANLKDDKQEMGSPTQRRSLFKKSATSATKDGSGSPSSARRKVSPHHTKILQRQQTPIEIKVPKNIISEAMRERTPDAFLEEEDEDES